MTGNRASARQRLLQGLYGIVQNQSWLKRLAVRMVMWFPSWGERIMASVGVSTADMPAEGNRVADQRATLRYRQGGYRALLLPESPLPAQAPPRQLLIDLSGLVQRDARTGIQRVSRNLSRALAQADLPGWRVEPIYVHQGRFHYARSFTTADWRLPALALQDEPISVSPGDVFFTPDLALLPISQMQQALIDLRAQGVAVHFVLHDIIPLTHPQFYQGEVDPRFARWLTIVLELADSLLCVSAAVREDVRRYLTQHPPKRADGGPELRWFHLGANLPVKALAQSSDTASKVAARRELAATTLPSALQLSAVGPQTQLFLMVGTLEPRKGHAQVLEAFEALWREGQDVALVLIGKVGWNVKALVERLRSHAQAGERLCWLANASDEVLCAAYERANALIAASYVEGFGLPLIEAAQYGLPVIARDIPVFREVAGNHAYYFQAEDGSQLARALAEWMALAAQGQAPVSTGMPYLTWEQSAQQVASLLLPT